jgi:uncharacterized protein YdbL (DUF1318 family)
MKARTILIWLAAVLVAVGISCVTVNIYFPAAEVQKAADRIVEEVRPEAPPPPQQPPAPPAEGSLLERPLKKLVMLFAPEARAQVDIDISSPAVRKLKASIKERFSALRPFYKKGAIGENNRGYLQMRDTKGLTLKEKSTLKRLVREENADRKALYEEIVRVNKLAKEVIPEVERLFANSWRRKARAKGWWVQEDDGTWTR